VGLAGVAALELIFGSWLHHDSWERALALRIVVNRRLTYDATRLYAGGGPVMYTRDRYGLRGDYGQPADIDILTIGGSTTDQRYVADGSTWQDELERTLRAAGRDVQVANAGVDGHSTFGHLASYQYWFPLIPGLRPAHTILYVGLNDFFVDITSNEFEGRTDGEVTLRTRVAANSAFYGLYALTRGMFAAWQAGLPHDRLDAAAMRYTETPNLRNHDAIARARFGGFQHRMTALLDRVRRSDSMPVCVTQPSLIYRRTPEGALVGVEMLVDRIAEGPLNGVDYFRLRSAQDAIMAAACRNASALVVDLASQTWENEDFYDLSHTTPRGATKVGRRIAAAMGMGP
jgi:hypothetical protein